MRRVTAAGAVLVATVLLAGCGGSDGKDHADSKGGGADKAPASKPLAKLNVPAAYDASKGWDDTLNWVPESVSSIPVAPVADNRAVAMMYAASGGYTLKVRDAADGTVRWTSTAWNPPVPVEGADGDPDMGEAAEIPDVVSLQQGGRTYVVAYAHGMRGKDDLHKGTEVVRVAIYPADATGSSVTPQRQIDVPVTTGLGEQLHTSADGGRLLIGWGKQGELPASAAAVDVATGKVSRYSDANSLLPQCAKEVGCYDSRVAGATSDSVVVAMDGGGFGVPGRWFSNAVRPGAVAARTGFLGAYNGDLYGMAGSSLVAGWSTNTTDRSDRPAVWTVHDVETGKVQAQVTCAADLPGGSSKARDYPVVTSPNGRYVAAGSVAFDVQRKKGICLQGDGNRKTIVLGSIRNDGIAYGAVVEDDAATSDSDPVVAQVDLNTGQPQVLGTGVEAPYTTDLKGSGLFLDRDDDHNVRISLRRQR
ncbi:hypothetical protein ACIBUY_04460 [Streptomyces sp. NPDC050085]|uniref:hypothetical protein n=1 Tax=Streptomyces sp. NPDC050085 TaxID=3365600 RepID=UPI00379A6340